jgi:hypothetical protein
MNSAFPVLIGFILAIIGCILGWSIANRHARYVRKNLLAQVQQAEKELLEDVDRIGQESLHKTESGRKLLHLLEIKDLSFLLEAIPNLEMALKFTGRSLTNMNFSIEEWYVLKFVDPQNTMRQIAQTNKMSDFEIREIVYSLLEAGLVEITSVKKPQLIEASETELVLSKEQAILELVAKGTPNKEEK